MDYITCGFFLMCRNFLSRMFESVGSFSRGIEAWSIGSKFVLCFLFCRFYVIADFFSVCLIVIGKHIGVGHADGLDAEDSRHLLFVGEVGVAEFFEPVEVVKDRMGDAIVSS